MLYTTTFLIAVCLLSPISLYLRFAVGANKVPVLKVFSFNFLLIWLGLLVLVFGVYEAELQAMLHSFDLDGDSVFSEREQTPGQIAVMARVTNDTWQVFWPLSASCLAIIHSLVFWLIIRMRLLGDIESL